MPTYTIRIKDRQTGKILTIKIAAKDYGVAYEILN